MRISHEKWSHNKDTFLERLPLSFWYQMSILALTLFNFFKYEKKFMEMLAIFSWNMPRFKNINARFN